MISLMATFSPVTLSFPKYIVSNVPWSRGYFQSASYFSFLDCLTRFSLICWPWLDLINNLSEDTTFGMGLIRMNLQTTLMFIVTDTRLLTENVLYILLFVKHYFRFTFIEVLMLSNFLIGHPKCAVSSAPWPEGFF
jgi:hypothetical protein